MERSLVPNLKIHVIDIGNRMVSEDSEGESSTGRADAVLHPIRLRIINSLSPNLQLTAPQIHEMLPDLPKTSLYRHLGLLLKAEAIQTVDVSNSRGLIEKAYRLPEQEVVVSAEELAVAHPDDLVRYFTNFTGAMLGHGRRFFSQTDPAIRKGGLYSANALYLTDEEFEQLDGLLENLTALLKSNQPGNGRKRRMFYTVILPD